MIRDKGLIGEWISEGEARGEARGAQAMLLDMLKARFGELPPALAERVGSADARWCRSQVPRVLRAERLEELAW